MPWPFFKFYFISLNWSRYTQKLEITSERKEKKTNTRQENIVRLNEKKNKKTLDPFFTLQEAFNLQFVSNSLFGFFLFYLILVIFFLW